MRSLRHRIILLPVGLLGVEFVILNKQDMHRVFCVKLFYFPFTKLGTRIIFFSKISFYGGPHNSMTTTFWCLRYCYASCSRWYFFSYIWLFFFQFLERPKIIYRHSYLNIHHIHVILKTWKKKKKKSFLKYEKVDKRIYVTIYTCFYFAYPFD